MDNQYNLFLSTLPFLIYAWIVANPDDATRFLMRLKRAWRSYLIQKYGTHLYTHFAQRLRREAQKQGFSHSTVERVLNDERSNLVHQFGSALTNQQLGPPTFFEDHTS